MSSEPLHPLVLTLLNQAVRIVNDDGKPTTAYLQSTNNAYANILTAFNALASSQNDLSDLFQQIIDLNGLVTSVDAKVTAGAAAQNLANSKTTPASVLTATSDGTTGTITVADHMRVYGNGTFVAVKGDTITGLAAGQFYYIFYDDPTRAGGVVTYQHSIEGSDAAQIGAVHSVGGAEITTTVDGGSPGYGNPGPGVPPYQKRFEDPLT